ncbi:hypothetical protein [Dinoroseobacter sp. S375]|uniref:hypothetical protein n=1 Tax=Dinoroseobacter sp. S375 TaxID=3415136 RepID=UPI003C7CC720
MKSAFETLNTERMRREAIWAAVREWTVPVSVGLLLIAAITYWPGPKAIGQFQYDMEAGQ